MLDDAHAETESDHPFAPYYRARATNRPSAGLPAVGHRFDAHPLSIGACFNQGFDVLFRTTKDTLIASLNGFDAVLTIDGGPAIQTRSHPGLLQWLPKGARVDVKTGSRNVELVMVTAEDGVRDAALRAVALDKTHAARLDKPMRAHGGVGTTRAALGIRRFMLQGMKSGGPVALALGRDLLHGAFRCFGAWDPRRAQPGLHPKKIALVVECIDARLAEDLSIKDLAENCELTQPHFTSAFKAATGMTPYQYLLDRRLARARDLLARSNLPTVAVAYDCGFSSQAHMTDLFHKKFGVTPAKFRKEFTKLYKHTNCMH